MPLLELDGCGLTLGGRAVLDGVTISLARGASLGVTGMSGAGKTMLALAIGGLLPAGAQQGGEIRFDGMPLPSSERVMVRLRGQRIGLLLGDGSMGLDPLRPVGKQAPAEALAAIGLGGRATALPHALSEAEQRRALLAQALAAHPDLLVLDEPAHGLDPVAAHALHALIAAQQKQHGFALLLLGRDHRTIAALCPEIAVLHQGRIVETGPATDVFVRPQHDHTRDLVAAAKLKTRTLTRPPIGADLLTVSGVQFPLSGGTGAVAELS